MSERIIKRGEVYWADLTAESDGKKKDQINKIRKPESQKERPVVVISNDKQNKYSEEVIICLITSQLDKVYYFEPIISLKKPSKILTDNILTIDKVRLGEKITILTTNEMINLEKALHAVLSLRTYCQQNIFTPEIWQLLQSLTKKEEIDINQLLKNLLKDYANQKK